MNTKHTPGPWSANNFLVGYRKDPDMPICTVIAEINTVQMKSEEEGKANARLIADAPALLEALSQILTHCALASKVWGDGAIDTTPIIENAYALVAKHTGRELDR